MPSSARRMEFGAKPTLATKYKTLNSIPFAATHPLIRPTCPSFCPSFFPSPIPAQLNLRFVQYSTTLLETRSKIRGYITITSSFAWRLECAPLNRSRSLLIWESAVDVKQIFLLINKRFPPQNKMMKMKKKKRREKELWNLIENPTITSASWDHSQETLDKFCVINTTRWQFNIFKFFNNKHQSNNDQLMFI